MAISFYATGCEYIAHANFTGEDPYPTGIPCPEFGVENITGNITIYADEVYCDDGYSLPAKVYINGEYSGQYLQSTYVSFSSTGVTNVQVIATRDDTNPQGTVYINRGTGVSEIYYDYCVNGNWYSGDSSGSSTSDFAVTADVGSKINITNYTFTDAAIYGLPTTFQPYTSRTYATTTGTPWTSAKDKTIDVTTATRYVEITASLKETTYYGRLKLNGNGGTFSGNQTSINWPPVGYQGASGTGGALVTITLPLSTQTSYIPTRDGYRFDGWVSENGSSFYSSGDDVSFTANSTYYSSPTEVDLYAVWEEKTDIELFYWNGSDTADAALIAKGQPVSNITATRWNNLLAKIKELADAVGVSFSYTAVSSGDGITAARFNVARTGIANIKTALGTTTVLPDAQSKGNTMYATLFTGNGSIKSALNHLIGVYNDG